METIGGGGLTRIEYVRAHIADEFRFPDGVEEGAHAPFLQDLARFAVGLAAQESRFDNNAESHMGASRIFQFMEETHEDLGYTEADMLLLTNQVEAASKYLSRAYAHIWRDAQPALRQIQERFFRNNPIAFQREFMLPVLINSYNAGPTRMIQAVSWFADTHATHEEIEHGLEAEYDQTRGYGYDVFHLMTRAVRERGRRNRRYPTLNRYGQEASEYVARIRAFMTLIETSERETQAR
jgi:soluble lytic murein transglycosylase-like protein